MSKLSKRSVLRASVGFVAASALTRPYIANAAAKTASVWWAQGFIPEEDRIAADPPLASEVNFVGDHRINTRQTEDVRRR
jgi:hypothetical protein